MTKPMVRIHDVATDEIIDREMTDAEFTEHKKRQQIARTQETEAEAKAQAKAAAQAKLAALGLTISDLEALGL